MGATAITVLADSRILLLPHELPIVVAPSAVVPGLTPVLWAFGAGWVPLLVTVGEVGAWIAGVVWLAVTITMLRAAARWAIVRRAISREPVARWPPGRSRPSGRETPAG